MLPRARDPVCGMSVNPATSRALEFEGARYSFCSDYCLDAFRWNPSAYAAAAQARAAEGTRPPRIAYLSMEVAVDPRMPIYSGGLGVLAGDTLRSCADLGLPVIGITLLHRKGYFSQALDGDGGQVEREETWDPERCLRPLSARAHVSIEDRTVQIRAWQYDVPGARGLVPLLLLDTDVAENSDPDRRLTDSLYGGDERYRLAQEIVLGIGGVRMLESLGHHSIRKFHLNEGHASLAALELFRMGDAKMGFDDVRERIVFTTHTPVPAGHDRFDHELVQRVLGEPVPRDLLRMLSGTHELNTTQLALSLAGYVNGVARKHREVSSGMFPEYAISSVTNGVHSVTWTSVPLRALFDRHVPGWREDPALLRQAMRIPGDELRRAHAQAKRALLDEVKRLTGRELAPEALTIGFARRAASYKRADLIFSDVPRLRSIRRLGPLQLVFAGKAHPKDSGGKELIRRVSRFARELGDEIPVVYLPDYGLDLAKLLVAGVDVWLNTPQRPLEASGTSGMKAAHNGVPSLSVLDGWWLEGHIEGVTGWSVGRGDTEFGSDADDAADLYAKLPIVLDVFQNQAERWAAIMRSTIALNASFFNSQRMVLEYATSAYLL
ncbi:alpha-glucan family phosphorylase [Anaeromyxobacter terrae]|uniref:alpha-glucan family phosphorylase n=1 Tax=Anaeromyxobacter terrae TaxID=2925406 RepID=UPI001F55BEED|nr:alpha-glucan family phosphorylase [Anaeromyxobacter sp. SG22]